MRYLPDKVDPALATKSIGQMRRELARVDPIIREPWLKDVYRIARVARNKELKAAAQEGRRPKFKTPCSSCNEPIDLGDES